MTNYDICVIGGGPSGGAIARRLVQFGYSLVIVEKEIFPRGHVGISMSPGVHHWLNVLGVREEVEQAGFIPATSAVLLWESNVPNRKETAGGFHADRGVFDQILLNAAVSAGADLIQPCKQIFLEENAFGEWKITSSSFSFTAKFIVEATGRRSVLKGTKTAFLPPVLATYAYWDAQIDASFIEAGKNHWYWAVPAGCDKLMACIFTDPKDAPSVKDEYLSRMKDFSLLYQHLQHTTFGKVSVCSATAYVDKQPVSHNYIKVGDAAFSTDPISAQGVQKALKTAVQGAVVINTILSNKHKAGIAINFYREMIQAEVRKNLQWTQQHYNTQKRYESGEFWENRKSNIMVAHTERNVTIKKSDKLFINPNSVRVIVPVILGKYIEEEEGIVVPDNEEPFVFIQNYPVAYLIDVLHNKELTECLMIARLLIPNAYPMDVLKWLLFHRLMVEESAAALCLE